MCRRDGETGRREGLKIPFPQGSPGSSPGPGILLVGLVPTSNLDCSTSGAPHLQDRSGPAARPTISRCLGAEHADEHPHAPDPLTGMEDRPVPVNDPYKGNVTADGS